MSARAKAQEERKIEEAGRETESLMPSRSPRVLRSRLRPDVPANDIKRLFLLGTLTMTQSMSDDLVELVADDLGRQIKIITP